VKQLRQLVSRWTISGFNTVVSFLAALVEGWKAFWFRPGDPTVLGFIRVCTGLVLLYILVFTTPILVPLYGPDGWVDQQAADMFRKEMPWLPPPAGWDENAQPEVIRPEARDFDDAARIRDHWGIDPVYTIDLGQPFFSPFYHLVTPEQMFFVHGLAIGVALLFTLGVGTRVTSVLAWILALGYAHRTPASMFGQDTMLAILLLYLMIGPAGAALSVDRLIARWGMRRQGLPIEEPKPSVGANLAIRLMQVHFCLIYLASGTSKLQGAAWWNGTAIWQTLTNYEFAPAQFEACTQLLRLLTYNRWVWEAFHFGGSLFTLGLELGLPFLIWNPRCRWVFIAGAVCLHTFIALSMGLVAFSLLMITMLFSFIPPDTLKGFLARLSRLADRKKARETTLPRPAVPESVRV
jgi:hypothetical protein